MLQVAVLGLPGDEGGRWRSRAGLPPSVKVTLPVGCGAGHRRGEERPCRPPRAGLAELVSVVVVDDGGKRPPPLHAAAGVDDAGAAERGRAVAAVPVGNARAVVWIFDITCAGVSAGFLDNISEAMPATCGVAMLVPL